MAFALDPRTLHPSTALALEALEWLEERIQPSSILDMGCGNGALSLACAHLWECEVLACDIAEEALRDAAENQLRYAPEADLRFVRSDGFKHPQIAACGPYDLILANLLAQWQVQMARDMQTNLNPGGMVVLSGVLAWQAEGVVRAFESIKLDIIQSFDDGFWKCYVLCHNPPSTQGGTS